MTPTPTRPSEPAVTLGPLMTEYVHRGVLDPHAAETVLDARRSDVERLRVAFESRFDDQWPEWMNEAWNEAVDEVAS